VAQERGLCNALRIERPRRRNAPTAQAQRADRAGATRRPRRREAPTSVNNLPSRSASWRKKGGVIARPTGRSPPENSRVPRAPAPAGATIPHRSKLPSSSNLSKLPTAPSSSNAPSYSPLLLLLSCSLVPPLLSCLWRSLTSPLLHHISVGLLGISKNSRVLFSASAANRSLSLLRKSLF